MPLARSLTTLYQWSSAFDANTFLQRLAALMKASGLPGGTYPQPNSTKAALGNVSAALSELRFPILQKGFTPDTYSQFGITFSPADAQGGAAAGIALLPYIMGAADFQFNVCDRGQLTFQSSADIKGVGVVVRPPFNAQGILNAAGDFSASITIAEKPEKAEETILVGSAGGSRLSVQGLGVSWFAKTTSGKLDIGIEGQIQAIRVVIGGGDGDGFIQQILSGLNVQAEAQLGLGMSLLSGFTITGGGKLTIELSVSIDLGPVSIDALQLTLAPAAEQFQLGAGVNLTANLGPLAASVEGIGLQTALQFKHGNLGPAQLDVSFLPPKGVGLAVNAGVVQGGGFLYIDSERGEYAGALQLEIADFLSVSAIGLISTKMPDGSSGFSLLIIIAADFGAGIQLSFGFTLLAVGGLLGLNRTVLFQPLMDGVRTNSIQSIMFPQDVIANAPRIISDLRAIFPPQNGTFLIGPMAKIGWGEPTLISLSLGVIIEIPPGRRRHPRYPARGPARRRRRDSGAPGQLRRRAGIRQATLLLLRHPCSTRTSSSSRSPARWACCSPTETTPISSSQSADFIRNSIRRRCRSPRRSASRIDLINESFARIHAEGYFAVTTNTVQFGTHSDFFFGFSACSVSGTSGFDALIQFSPFHFIAEISTQFSVKVFGIGVYGVGIDVSLEVPRRGTCMAQRRCRSSSSPSTSASISPGATIPTPRCRRSQVMPILSAKRKSPRTGRQRCRPNLKLLVTLRQLDPSEAGLVLHPGGNAAGQPAHCPSRSADRQIRQPGAERRQPVRLLGLGAALDEDARSAGAVRALAVPQLRRRRPSCRSPPSCRRTAASSWRAAAALCVVNRHHAAAALRPHRGRCEVRAGRINFFAHSRAMFTNFLAGNSAGQSTLSANFRGLTQPHPGSVAVASETFAVAFQSNNQVFHPEAAAFLSQAQAQDYISNAVAANPSLEGTLHVIPQFEVAA